MPNEVASPIAIQGNVAIGVCEMKDAAGREGNRDPLRSPKALTKCEDAQQDIDKWCDEVTEAGLDDETGIDRPHVQEPVEAYEERGDQCTTRPRRTRSGAMGSACATAGRT